MIFDFDSPPTEYKKSRFYAKIQISKLFNSQIFDFGSNRQLNN